MNTKPTQQKMPLFGTKKDEFEIGILRICLYNSIIQERCSFENQ